MMAAFAAGTSFVLARLFNAAHGLFGSFIVAGSEYVNRTGTARGLPIRSGSGYDGQFYYRLALDPFDLARATLGIRIDTNFRTERIGYSFLSWLTALGHQSAIPYTLVIVNVLAFTVVGLAGGLLAQSAGRHALWGLVFSGYWGYLWTLGRDLTELTTAAFALLGIAALVREAPVWSGLAFLAATLCKETAVLLAGSLALVALWGRLRGRHLELRRVDLSFAIPLVGFALWQLVLLISTGHVAVLDSGQAHFGPPLVGLVQGVVHYFATLFTAAWILSILWFAELIVLVLVGIGAARSIRMAPANLQFLCSAFIVLALCANKNIWLGHVGFRSLDIAYLMSWVVLMYRSGQIWRWATLCAGIWWIEAVQLIRYI